MSRNLQLQVVLNAIDKATRPIKAVMDSSSGLGKQLKQTRDQLKGLQAQQSDINSFKSLKAASEQSRKAMDAQQQKVKELAMRMRQTETPTKTLTKEFESATRQAQRLKQRHADNNQQLHEMRSKLSASGVSTARLGDAERGLSSRINEANKSLAEQQNRLKRLTEQQKRLSAAKSQYERTTQLASNITMTGAGSLGVAYGIQSTAQRVIAPGIEYGAQMSELQAVSRLDKDDERFKLLKQQARELGASTAFSATDVGAGQTFLARAGFSPEAINASMQDILDLALANGVDLARTADIASNISGAFKIDPKVEGSMRRVGDVLSGVSARANVDLEMLGDTMKYLGKAEGLGLSLEQSAAMAGVLGNIGIQASQAGTTMRAMLDRLSAPAAAGAKAMAALGLEVKDATGSMRDIPDIIGDVAKATASMGNVEQAKYLQEIFGAEAGSGMAELIAQQGTGGLTKLIEELHNVHGESSRMAKTRADNIDGDLKSLASAWAEIGIGITDVNEGPLRGLIQQVTGVLRAIGEWTQKNPELVATIAKVAAAIGILAGIGGALMVTIGSILGPLAMMRYGLTVLGIKGGALIPVIKGIGAAAMALGKTMLASPLGIFAAVATAAVVAAVLLIKNWDLVKAFFKGFFSGIAEGFAETSRALANTFSPAAAALKSIVKVVASVIGWLKNLMAPVSSAKESLEGAAAAGRFFGKALGSLAALTVAAVAIKAVGTALVFMGKAALASPVFAVIAAIALAAYMIYKNWAPIKEFFVNLWNGASSTMRSAWNEIKEAFSGGIGGISALIINWSPLGLFYKAFAGVMDYFGVELPSKLTEFGGNIISSFVGGAAAAWSAIAEFFSSRWTDIDAAFDGGIAGVGALIVNWSPLGLFYQAFAGVMDYFGVELPGKFTEFGSMIVQGLISGIKNMGGAVKDAVLGMGDSVTGWFKGKLGIQSPSRVFMQFGGDTAEGLALGIEANKDSPLKQVAGMAKQVAAAGAIALSVGVTPAVADNKNISQSLQPSSLPIIQDQQQAIRQTLVPVAQPEIQDQQQRVLQSLQPATLPVIQDQQQAIRQSLVPVAQEQQTLPALTQNIQQMIISAKQVLPELTQRVIRVFSGPSSAAPEAQKKLFSDQPSIRFDTRAPISTPAAQRSAPQPAANISIHVHPSAGMDEARLAQLVQRELEKAQQQQKVRTRSTFGDLD